MKKILKIDEKDNLIVALTDLPKGLEVSWNNKHYTLVTDVAAKHKFSIEALEIGDIVYMYGVPVGKAIDSIQRGEVVTTQNIKHFSAPISLNNKYDYIWNEPDVTEWEARTFKGYMRDDGRIGTRNYWLIIPLVFCENRNATKLQQALSKPLGYGKEDYADITNLLMGNSNKQKKQQQMFENVDGIRAIHANGGCGGTNYDARSFCRILANYADHPNVAGVTVFSLGCEKAQIALFKEELSIVNSKFDKPLLFFRQQDWDSEEEMMKTAISDTFAALTKANNIQRVDVPLSKLKIGVKCGGSDGFSGISANPVMGKVSDRIVALGGASCLAEFPELCGAEANILERCINFEDKKKFLDLMEHYEKTANFQGATIADNPSPGNIKDGLITDAIKSAGAAKKGGAAPISSVKDYGELMPDKGFSLVCTPGNDLEAVTGQVAAGANIIIFSTGLGTPTGNPIVPVIKVATNNKIAHKLIDMIDFNCGPVIEGESLDFIADGLLECVINTASGDYEVKADALEQYDFMFWKQNTSL